MLMQARELPPVPGLLRFFAPQGAGFVPLEFAMANLQLDPSQSAVLLNWGAPAGGSYQVEYSPDLSTWFESPTGDVTVPGPSASWTDSGPPSTVTSPFSVGNRFYRVFQFGPP